MPDYKATQLNVTLAILTIFQIVLAMLMFNRSSKVLFKQDRETYTYLDEDYPRLWPIQDALRVLLFHEPYTIHYHLDDDLEWEALSPGNGTIYLGPTHEPFSISMFHQLRCINIIRRSIVDRENPDRLELTRHCFNYLRQIVLCRADFYADAEALADYMICKDWQFIYAEVEKNHRSIP